MIPFRAIYKPTKFVNEFPDGLDEEKAEPVLVIKVFHDGAVMFIGDDGRLDMSKLEHFSECIWREE